MIGLLAETPNLGSNLPHIDASQTTLGLVLNAIYALAGILAVVFIIVGGIRYTLSGGDASGVAKGKNTIVAAIVGLVITLLAFAITNFIISRLAVGSYNELRDSVINTLIYVAGAVAVIAIVWGGFRYALSGGDAGKVKQAKNTILYAVVGLVIALLAFVIVNFVIGSI